MGAYQDRKQSGGEKKESDLIRVAGLWKLKSGKGLSGGVDEKALDAIADAINKGKGKATLLLFTNTRKKDKSPDYVLFVAPAKERTQASSPPVERQGKDEFADMF